MYDKFRAANGNSLGLNVQGIFFKFCNNLITSNLRQKKKPFLGLVITVKLRFKL